MFCPECKCEYVEGIRKCVDCGVELVWELPPEPGAKPLEPGDIEDEMVHIGMYRDPGSAEMVKDFLLENGVEAVPVEYRFDGVTRLYVPKKDELKAGKLLMEFEGTSGEDSKEDTTNEMETEYEEPGFWRSYNKMRQSYHSIAWLIFGIASIFFGIYLITLEKKYFHGIILTAGGVFIVVFVIRRWFRVYKQKREKMHY